MSDVSVRDSLALPPRLRIDQAIDEASRCLQCFDPPCTKACPAGIVIPRFIRMIRSANLVGAAEVVRAANPMAASSGIACPDDELCGAACIRAAIDRPVAIRELHRFATEIGESRSIPEPAAGPRRRAGGRVAVVGAGPAGLACAFELRRAGVPVTVFDAGSRPGGVLARTIPLYRFPGEFVRRDVSYALGKKGRQASITLHLRSAVTDIEKLSAEYDAVFVAVGLTDALPSWAGTELGGVVSATEFLARSRTSRYRNPIGNEIAVIGGGNVAIDAALAAVHCGAVQGRSPRVHLLYRRSRREMPAWEREVTLAEKVGVLLHFLVVPGRFVGESGRLTGVELLRTRLAEGGAGKRPRPVAIPGTSFLLPCDQAILATGQVVDREVTGALPLTRRGFLRVRSRSGHVTGSVFAGGDAVGGDQTIVAAVRDGKAAAGAILEHLEAR
jgi:glutamate synthase (NADPH/NADH) small chain